jgi:hypothetical protein
MVLCFSWFLGHSDHCLQTSRDVLNDHRIRNHANRPPSAKKLLASVQQQLADEIDDEEIADEEADDDDSDTEQSRQRTQRNSKSKGPAQPTILKYYDGAWREALKTAKKKFRRFTMLYNAFPVRSKDLPSASQILSRVVDAMKDEDVVFDPAIQQTRAMNCLVCRFIPISFYYFY